MAIILVTGMSGTGKSTVLAELARRGHMAVDTDYGDWSEWVPLADSSGSEQLWREDRIDVLLSEHTEGALYISGTVSNQGKFYPRLDTVVLLSAPLEVILERVATRTTNPYGKTAEQRAEIAHYLDTVEPLLRAGSAAEIDTRRPINEVADELERIAASIG